MKGFIVGLLVSYTLAATAECVVNQFVINGEIVVCTTCDGGVTRCRTQ